MEWVETTGKTLDDAKDQALDQLGVAADEAEFEVLDEPRTGLFGRLRGEARVRARVRPAEVRPKQDRRQRGRGKPRSGDSRQQSSGGRGKRSDNDNGSSRGDRGPKQGDNGSERSSKPRESRPKQRSSGQSAERSGKNQERTMSNDSDHRHDDRPPVEPQAVGDAAVTFMSGLVDAFGSPGDTTLQMDGTDLEVTVAGDELGLLIGPGGRTLQAVQDLARVASQRRLGDHETRLRIDVAGYRERRRAALEGFAHQVAEQVLESGTAKALEPMSSADRKSVHDALNDIDGVTSHSEGDDPSRRIVISPA